MPQACIITPSSNLQYGLFQWTTELKYPGSVRLIYSVDFFGGLGSLTDKKNLVSVKKEILNI